MTERGRVVVVDEDGHELGTGDKLEAHRAPGTLHLAFSVFLFSPDGLLLLQRRAGSKYHFPGIWANTCCSHPQPGEELISSAEARLAEELGIGRPVAGTSGAPAPDDDLVLAGDLVEIGAFVYRAVDPASGLVEHEFDHVFVGSVERADGGPIGPSDRMRFDPAEVDDVMWAEVTGVRGAGPERGLAPWFGEALELVLASPRSPRLS